MKIGIVGCGSIGSRHRSNAVRLGHETKVYDLAMKCDFKFERELYDWCDAAVIATPSQFHEGPLRACIERGKHALVEKPISVSVGGLPALLDQAKAKGLTVMMGNNLRFHPCVTQTKRWLIEGRFGEPRWAHFLCATEPTATAFRDGVILNTGAHEVDLALHFFGPARILASSVERDGVDTIVDFVLRHDSSGVRSSFHLNIVSPKRVRQFWIGMEEKTLGADLDLRRFAGDGDYNGYHYGGSYADDYGTELQTFIARAQGEDGTQGLPGATGREGLETLAILEAIRDIK